MPYGKRSSRQRPHDAVSSSRVPSVEIEQPGLAACCRLTRRRWTNGASGPDGRRADGSEDAEVSVLTSAEEAIVVAFRQKTLLPLDDVLGCLRDAIPHLSRSAFHRCLQRHGDPNRGRRPGPCDLASSS